MLSQLRLVRRSAILAILCGCGAVSSAQQARVAYPSGIPAAPSAAAPLDLGESDAPALLLPGWGEFYANAIEARLGLGFRLTSHRLSETERPADEMREETFIGYVNELHDDHSSRIHPVVTYRLSEYLMLECTWDEVAAKTVNFNTGLSDGTIKMEGPTFMVVAQYPILGYICPYVGIGYAPWSASFDHERWWTLGWLTPEDYAAAGSPPNQRGERPRRMEVDNDSAIVYSLGVLLRLHRHVDMDFMVRHVSLTSKASFYRGDPLVLSREGEFPMDHTTYGIGLHGVF